MSTSAENVLPRVNENSSSEFKGLRKISSKVLFTKTMNTLAGKLSIKKKLPISKETINQSISEESKITSPKEPETYDVYSDSGQSFVTSDTVTETLSASEYESAEDFISLSKDISIRNIPINQNSVSQLCNHNDFAEPLQSASLNESVGESVAESRFNRTNNNNKTVNSTHLIDETPSKQISSIIINETVDEDTLRINNELLPGYILNNYVGSVHLSPKCGSENGGIEQINCTEESKMLVPQFLPGDEKLNKEDDDDFDHYYECETQEKDSSGRSPFRNNEKYWETTGEKNMGSFNDLDFVIDYNAELKKIMTKNKSNLNESDTDTKTLIVPSGKQGKFLPGCIYQNCPEFSINNSRPEENKKKEFYYKILLVGERKAGKTSFLQRYTRNFFTESYRPSYGVEFAKKNFNWEQNVDLKLLFCDIAGDELAWPLKRTIYELSKGAFIIHDANQLQTLPQALEFWKKDLRDKGALRLPNGEFIPLILLLNKGDESEPDSVAVDDLCSTYSICTWYNISAKENFNLDLAVYSLVTKILSGDPRVNKPEIKCCSP